MRKSVRWAGCGLILVLGWSGVGRVPVAAALQGQGSGFPQPPSSRGSQQQPSFGGQRQEEMPGLADTQARLERTRNSERQKRLVADSDKLLQLATQLHEDVGKTDKNILSMDVINRAQQIEKLAHDVKERMKG